MELTWVFSVLGLMLRLAAIWAFDFPTVRNARTSFSRGVSRQRLALMILRSEVNLVRGDRWAEPFSGYCHH